MYLTDRDMCYNGNGTTYNGNVNVTKKFQTCLHWSKVTHCVNNLYQRRYYETSNMIYYNRHSSAISNQMYYFILKTEIK